MSSLLSVIICQLFFITFSYASSTTTTGEPNNIDNANNNLQMNTIPTNEQSLSSNATKGGFHLPFEHKQLLAWIIGGLFIWCSITICCVLFVKRTINRNKRIKHNQHKVNISHMMGQRDDVEYHHAGRYKNNGGYQQKNTNSTVIEEEEEEEQEQEQEQDDIYGQEEIINQVKNMEAKRMSKTDKLVQELKIRQLAHKQEVNDSVMVEINELNIQQPSSPVTNPVEFIRTPPPPPPPGIAGVDYLGNVVQAQLSPNQTYANPNPGY